MRTTFIRIGLALGLLVVLLPVLAGCGSKSEEKASGDYYTGPMQGKGSAAKAGGTSKQD
jgi:hypothetical protein